MVAITMNYKFWKGFALRKTFQNAKTLLWGKKVFMMMQNLFYDENL